MTLTEFLLARVAEDESVARAAVEHDWPRSIDDRDVDVSADAPSNVAYFAQVEHVERFDPARALAECEAKRQIVELHTPGDIGYGDCTKCDGGYDEHEFYPCQTLRALALPYADHPDCDESWRP